MAMQAEPLTRLSEDIASAKRAIARLVRADGIVTREEEQIERTIVALHEEAAQYEAWRVTGDAIRRCGPNPYTRRVARENGLWLIEGGKHDEHGPEAA